MRYLKLPLLGSMQGRFELGKDNEAPNRGVDLQALEDPLWPTRNPHGSASDPRALNRLRHNLDRAR